MKRQRLKDLEPFLSLLFVVATLFSFVFVKIELRRMGYAVLKETRQYKLLRDEHRSLTIEYAKRTTPERVQHIAVNQLTMNRAKMGQIIQLTGQRLAVPQ